MLCFLPPTYEEKCRNSPELTGTHPELLPELTLELTLEFTLEPRFFMVLSWVLLWLGQPSFILIAAYKYQTIALSASMPPRTLPGCSHRRWPKAATVTTARKSTGRHDITEQITRLRTTSQFEPSGGGVLNGYMPHFVDRSLQTPNYRSLRLHTSPYSSWL